MTPAEVRALIERVEAEERSAGWAVSDVLAVCRLLREALDALRAVLDESMLLFHIDEDDCRLCQLRVRVAAIADNKETP